MEKTGEVIMSNVVAANHTEHWKLDAKVRWEGIAA